MCNQNLSYGGATYIIGEIIVKDNLFTENLMQTFENLPLQNCTTKFLDIAHKYTLGMYVQLKFVQIVAPPTLFAI